MNPIRNSDFFREELIEFFKVFKCVQWFGLRNRWIPREIDSFWEEMLYALGDLKVFDGLDGEIDNFLKEFDSARENRRMCWGIKQFWVVWVEQSMSSFRTSIVLGNNRWPFWGIQRIWMVWIEKSMKFIRNPITFRRNRWMLYGVQMLLMAWIEESMNALRNPITFGKHFWMP